MSNPQTIHPLTIREFVYRYMEDENVFNVLPHFSFIKPLASKWKNQNCSCGLGPDIKRTIDIYNDVVKELDESVIESVRNYFSLSQVCFAIQTEESHQMKCY